MHGFESEERMAESPEKTFAELGLRNEMLAILSALGYEQPTPIQEKTIPVLLSGRDVIGQAQTGTGKTAAFALPLLERIAPALNTTQALVLTPTRELAMQVSEAIHTYARGIGHLSILPIYGGAPMGVQLKRLERGVQIVVGTPGRLIDHLDRGSLDLAGIRMIVLDEADEMLKMGFIEEVERILAAASEERQVALFSATMPDEVLRIAQRYLKDPVRIEIERKAMTAPAIEQRFLNVSEAQKLDALTQILELEQSEAALIFRRTKNGAAELAEKLEGRGFAAEAMHGDMTQAARESVVRRLRSGQVELVVATDVAARGLDVEQIEHVINYDMPNDVEVYVHRIGRTGRAGRSGMATLFVTPRERRMLREIERYVGAPVKPMKMPTRADVAAKRIDVFKEKLRKELEADELDLYVQLVEAMVDEGTHDITEVAAAAARLANGSRSLAPEPEPVREERAFERRQQRDFVSTERPRPSSDRPSRPSAERAPRSDAGDRPPRGGDDEAKVRLSISVGKNDGIRPADIVGSIANEADVPGREIGPIDIRDDMTIVVIPERYRDQVLEKTARAKFRGRPLNVKVASARDNAAPMRAPRRDDERKPFAPRERKSFAPREGAGERKPYAPRERSTERRPYGDRAQSDERRPFANRDRAGARVGAPRERAGGDRASAPKRTFGGDRERAGGYERKPSFSRDRGAAPRGASSDRERPRGGSYERSEGPAKKGFYSGFAGKKGGGKPFKKR